MSGPESEAQQPAADGIRLILVMGVAGSGKTTVGSRLAAALGWTFYEGDAFHPPENIRKMAAGVPLDDADRAPWLDRLRALLADCLARNQRAVLACSALKESYRQRLSQGLPGLRFVYLTGDPDLIASRLAHRQGHYMKPGMLASQLAALEEPQDALRLDIQADPDTLVRTIRERLGL